MYIFNIKLNIVLYSVFYLQVLKIVIIHKISYCINILYTSLLNIKIQKLYIHHLLF